MDTLSQKFHFILDRNLAKANCTENQVCTSCDIVVVVVHTYTLWYFLDKRASHKNTKDTFNHPFILRLTKCRTPDFF